MHHAEFGWFRPSHFETVPHLQRALNEKRAQKIGVEWDPALVGVIEAVEVIDTDGNTIVHPVDGQTRIAGAKIHEAGGHEVLLPTVTYKDLSEKEIAQLFLARNQLSTRVSAFDQYMLGIVAKERWALAIKQVFTGRGSRFRIDKTVKANQVAAVGAVKRSMERSQKMLDTGNSWNEAKTVMRTTLEIIETAWPTEGGDRVNGDIIQAITWLITDEYEEFVAGDFMPLVKVLEQNTPKGWAVDAAKIKQDSFSSGARYRFIKELWVKDLEDM